MSDPSGEIHPQHPPVVPLPVDPFIPRRRLQHLVNLFPPGQFFRYVAVGVFNTVFGYFTYVLLFTVFTNFSSSRHPSLLAPLAVIVTTPVNITVAYFLYKIFVFKTHGNYLIEWLKCFGVYGFGMLPGLIVLSAFTRLLQALLTRHQAGFYHAVAVLQSHLSGRPHTFVGHIDNIPVLAGYLAGIVLQIFTVIASFVGHKRVTFAPKSVANQMH